MYEIRNILFKTFISLSNICILFKNLCTFFQSLGKVFSITMSMEMITPFATIPLYIMVYTKFMPPVYPCPVWLLSAGLTFLMMLIAIIIGKQINKCNNARYSPLLQIR